MIFPYLEWIQTDEKMKDSEWANKLVGFLRMYSTPLVNTERAAINMAYTLGVQDMTPIQNLFQAAAKLNLDNARATGIVNHRGDPVDRNQERLVKEMVGVNFRSMPVMEKILAMITAEIKKMGVILDVKCDDPTATTNRENDKALIKDRDTLEGFFNYIYTSIGAAPYEMDQHEARFGEKMGNGNIEEFKDMGFDNQNPSDIKFFMDNFHKLRAEIAAETCINAIMRQNQVEDVFFENWSTDFIAKKAIACQQHVSKLNGKIVYDYIAPEIVSIYGGGRRKDFNDATAKMVEQRLTIKELLDRVGDSFDFEKEMNLLFQAILYASNGTVEVTGIGTDPKKGWFYQTKSGGTTYYNYDSFMSQKVTFGYIEFISPNDKDFESEVKKQSKKDDKGVSEDYWKYNDNQPEDGKRYQGKARYETPTYCAYYLALTAYQQRLFNFGKVPYNDIEGYNDFDANWTLLTYKQIGEPIAEICAPFIDRINEAAYKFAYEVRRARPRGVAYNYDSMLAIAEETFTDTNLSRADKLSRIVEWFDSSANIVYKFPEVNGSVVPMTNNQMNHEMPNGLNQESMRWWEVMEMWWGKMLSVIGLDAPLRQGDPGGSRDSMNNQFKALEYSQNNTYYIPDGITYMTRMLGTRSMLYVQDIIQFHDHDTMAFSALKDLVGIENLQDISELGKKALHRYGIFVESLNQGPQRQRMLARIDLAIQSGKISNAEATLVEQIKSPKRQAIVLAYFEQRNTALQQKNSMQMQEQQAKQAMDLKAAEKDNIMLQGNIDMEIEKIKQEGAMQAHIITTQGGITKAQMKNDADSRQIYEQAQASLIQQQQSLNQTGQTTPPAMPSMIPLPTGYQNAIPQPGEKSGLQMNIEASQTAPTSAAM
jgi:hypothetical protein